MTTEDTFGPSAATDSGENNRVDHATAQVPDGMSSQRVFKKVSPNQKLTLYLSSRDLVVSPEGIDRLQGVLLVDPEFVEDRKVYGQVTLTFRYGREDEEVMGLKFCNEAIMCLAQLYPPHSDKPEAITPLQEALLKRLGPNAYPFNMEITPLAPPSVQLVPAKEYNGAPIGTSYDIRAYVDKVDEKVHRRSTVRMGIRVVQRAFAPPAPDMYDPEAAGRTRREKEKQNRKALLFGCKSAPLDTQFKKNEPAISRSAETVVHRKESRDVDRAESETETIWSPQVSKKDVLLIGESVLAKGELSIPVPATPIFQGELCGNRHQSQNSPVDENRCGIQVSFTPHSNGVGPDSEKGEGDHGVDLEEPQGDEGDDNASGREEDSDEETRIGQYYRNLCGSQRPSLAAYLAGVPAPRASAEKFYLLSDGQVRLTASLDKAIYSHGEDIKVTVQIQNNSNKTVKRIKIFIVQHVDVCMFSNGKFKNIVAMLNSKDDCPVHSGTSFERTYSLVPVKSSTKNWIALEESYNKSGTSLASTVTSTFHNPDDRNVFAIYVSYYVKVKLVVSMMGGEVSLKLPFTLMHTCSDTDQTETLMKVKRPDVQLELKSTAPLQCPEPVKPEKDGT